ncbi:MAG: hypothetical protein K2I20_03730, partial [Clostridia bacterium]|nr:hypothetical protein [Clostridia bacterium]
DYFIQGNSFLNVKEFKSNLLRLNGEAFKALEFKEDAFTVTFEGTGTLTIGFTSTGSKETNISGLAVKNAAGTCLTGTVDPNGATATLITAEDDTANNGYNVGFYRVVANNLATVTFNITEAGTYTIWCGNYGKKEDTANPGTYLPTNKAATHVRAIKMVDNGPQA